MIAVYIILIMMILGAIVAIETESLMSSVVSLGAVGLCFALISLIMHAPDVAITLLVVETMSVVVLIHATFRRDQHNSGKQNVLFGMAAAAVFAGALFVASAPLLDSLPSIGEPLMRTSELYARQAVPDTGAPNVVTSVLLDYRAYDSLGEATALFAAAVGVLAVTRRAGRKKESRNG